MRTLRVTEAKQAFDESVRASAKTNPNRSKKTKTKRGEMLLRQNRLEGARVRGESSRAKVEIGEDDKPMGMNDDLQCHLTCDEYCERLGIELGPKMSGGFEGWVENRCARRWASPRARTRRGKGTEEVNPIVGLEKARRRAITRNECFTRIRTHTFTDTRREKSKRTGIGTKKRSLFVEVAKKYGCGDKWGCSRLTFRVAWVTVFSRVPSRGHTTRFVGHVVRRLSQASRLESEDDERTNAAL